MLKISFGLTCCISYNPHDIDLKIDYNIYTVKGEAGLISVLLWICLQDSTVNVISALYGPPAASREEWTLATDLWVFLIKLFWSFFLFTVVWPFVSFFFVFANKKSIQQCWHQTEKTYWMLINCFKNNAFCFFFSGTLFWLETCYLLRQSHLLDLRIKWELVITQLQSAVIFCIAWALEFSATMCISNNSIIKKIRDANASLPSHCHHGNAYSRLKTDLQYERI